ncbi:MULTISPECIES: hypothetical protein [unclassified Sphingomonas]|uniref:hypothetical protein n=1 Tax=unclassified Sphingomonas TaxID=196159 RepID=UPI000A53AA94|nr:MULTISPECIES: hypothetical protein [unclassified Sphingomonas]
MVEENGAGSEYPADAIRYRLDQQRIPAEFGGTALRSHDIVRAANAVNYACGEGTSPVRIETRCADGSLTMTVADRGYPKGLDPTASRPTSLGMRMVNSLTRQLGGTLAFEDARPGPA